MQMWQRIPSILSFWIVFMKHFLWKKLIFKKTNNSWLTTGIRISCKHKRELICLKQNKVNKGRGFITYIKLYCKILKKEYILYMRQKKYILVIKFYTLVIKYELLGIS